MTRSLGSRLLSFVVFVQLGLVLPCFHVYAGTMEMGVMTLYDGGCSSPSVEYPMVLGEANICDSGYRFDCASKKYLSYSDDNCTGTVVQERPLGCQESEYYPSFATGLGCKEYPDSKLVKLIFGNKTCDGKENIAPEDTFAIRWQVVNSCQMFPNLGSPPDSSYSAIAEGDKITFSYYLESTNCTSQNPSVDLLQYVVNFGKCTDTQGRFPRRLKELRQNLSPSNAELAHLIRELEEGGESMQYEAGKPGAQIEGISLDNLGIMAPEVSSFLLIVATLFLIFVVY